MSNIHDLLKFLIGTEQQIGNSINRANLWLFSSCFVSFLASLFALIVSIRALRITKLELHEMAKSSEGDFVHRLMQDFFTDKTRALLILFDNELLEFKRNSENFPFFEAKKDFLQHIVVDKDIQKYVSNTYSAYEVDDLLIGYFEQMSYYINKGLIKIDMIYEMFGWYIEMCWENESIQDYIEWEKNESGPDIYDGFKKLYFDCTAYGKSKPINMVNKTKEDQEKTTDLQSLDILLYKGKGFTSWLIEVGTSSLYSHVAIVTDPQINLGIESNTGHQSGVRAFDLRKIQRNEVDVYRIKPEFQQKVDRQKVVSFLVGHLETKYDWRGVIGLALLKIVSLITGGLAKKWHNDFQRKKDYFCSELCYAAFNTGGLDIVPQVDSAAITSPGDISKSLILEKIK